MSLALIRRSELSREQIAGLEKAMSAFYQNPPASYYQIAGQAAQHYVPAEQPFHCDLFKQVFPGATVLEVGCGTAHLCPFVEQQGGIYTGLDYSEDLLKDNRQRFTKARFIKIGVPLAETFDIVASLYTVEHVVDPPAYLEMLWQHCRPGGLIGIICPEFVDSPGIAPSLYFGKTPRRLREKMRSFSLVDACSHLFELKLQAPRWKRQALSAAPGAFWINLRPRELHGAEHSIDADAVHLTRLKDLVWFFKQKNAEIVRTSDEMLEVSNEVRCFNCYLLAKKPGQ